MNHVYPVLLKPNDVKKIRIKILKQWQAINFRVNLASENSFIKTTNHDLFFIGIFYGMLFIYLLLLICFYIFSKSNFFLIYLGIIFFMLLLFLQYSGTGYQFVWFYSSTVQKYMTVVATLGYLTAHLSFIRTFFAVRFRNNFSAFILRMFGYLLAMFGVLFIIQLYNRSYGYLHTNLFYYIINGLFIIYGATVLGICAYSYKESRRREITWVMIGMLLHIASWVFFINNEFARIRIFNAVDRFQLFQSNIFIPQINYHLAMLEMLVVSVFIAINYHNLIRQNNLSAKRLEFLQKRNINTFVMGQEAERERISNEIGSVISKDISHLKKMLAGFDGKLHDSKLPAMISDIDKALVDIENITGNYVAPDMQAMKLNALIATATEKLSSELHVTYDFIHINESMQLNAAANINLYRVLQEISNNILKHANATNVAVSAIRDNKTLRIKISDDGIGLSKSANETKGIGLMNIESRMSSVNGNFYVLSNDKSGLSFQLIMPLKDIL
jgi:signal transduction histidine kinase